jgi:uncharacterized protein YecT (DUF1311 family)
MQRLSLILLPLFLITGGAAAAELNNQDETCEGPDFSTRVEACKLANRLHELENQLQKKYLRALKSYQSKEFSAEKSKLIASQKAWINYSNKTCNFENQAYGGFYSISRLRCLVRLTEARDDEIYAGSNEE